MQRRLLAYISAAYIQFYISPMLYSVKMKVADATTGKKYPAGYRQIAWFYLALLAPFRNYSIGNLSHLQENVQTAQCIVGLYFRP